MTRRIIDFISTTATNNQTILLNEVSIMLLSLRHMFSAHLTSLIHFHAIPFTSKSTYDNRSIHHFSRDFANSFIPPGSVSFFTRTRPAFSLVSFIWYWIRISGRIGLCWFSWFPSYPLMHSCLWLTPMHSRPLSASHPSLPSTLHSYCFPLCCVAVEVRCLLSTCLSACLTI